MTWTMSIRDREPCCKRMSQVLGNFLQKLHETIVGLRRVPVRVRRNSKK